jgi:uncharacterized protein
MSHWLIIDGYNIVAPIAPPGRGGDSMWLHHERMSLIRRLAERLPQTVRERTCVVFDAKDPPRTLPGTDEVTDQFVFEGILVRFAVGYDEADDLIEELIAAETVPKSLMVISTDRRIQTAATRRGAMTLDSDLWFDWLLDGRLKLAVSPSKYAEEADELLSDNREWDNDGNSDSHGKQNRGKTSQGKRAKPQRPQGDEVDQWMEKFGFDET